MNKNVCSTVDLRARRSAQAGKGLRKAAGIDGGGTGTTLVLLQEDGRQERRHFGAFNFNSIGEERFRSLLAVLSDVIAGAEGCEMVCIGAAGISNPQMKEMILEAGEKYGFSDRLMLRGDQEIALYGAMSGAAGAILIAGTGSICTGRGKDGRTVRTGGWGHLIDDVGSGYSIGRDVLRSVVRACDGRQEQTLLTELVQEHWRVSDLEGIIAKTYETTEKSNIAALSRLAEEGARRGDKAARQLLEENAEDLCVLAETVYDRLGEEELSMCLMGGLLSHDTQYRAMVTRRLQEGGRRILLKKPDMDAAAGAALWAWNTAQGR